MLVRRTLFAFLVTFVCALVVFSLPRFVSNTILGATTHAQAKDTVANSLNGLMKASRDAFAGRNLSGGSAEINSMGNILAQGNQQLADVARQQLERNA